MKNMSPLPDIEVSCLRPPLLLMLTFRVGPPKTYTLEEVRSRMLVAGRMKHVIGEPVEYAIRRDHQA